MILKIRCQICGRAGIVDTCKVSTWRSYAVEDFLSVKKEANYEFWLCGHCDAEYRYWKDNTIDNYYYPIIWALRPRKEEVESSEWEELQAEWEELQKNYKRR